MSNEFPEPTGDDVLDGTQLPTDDDLEDEEGDAGIGEAEIEYDEDPFFDADTSGEEG